MENPQKQRATSPCTTRLDQTLKALQESIKEQEALFEQLQAAASGRSISYLYQVRTFCASYESLILRDPYLPSLDSPLPALLALRTTQTCIEEMGDCIATTTLDLKKCQERLEKEQSDLNNARLIYDVIHSRILSLQEEIEEQSQMSPSEIFREMIRDMKKTKAHYDRETEKLLVAFNSFIDQQLAPMLAAEELGGPVVGKTLFDEDMVEGGFNAHGIAKKIKNGLNRDKRQRRISKIWGPEPVSNEKTKEPWTEKLGAGAEMRELTEQLLNGLVEADGDGPGAYIDLKRESAAARFLVRSQVAHFHPKDAGRLRLVDFGAELAD